MSTTLNEMQFELLPTIDATSGVVFGNGDAISVDENGFHPGSADWLTQDTANSTNGSTGFGRDRLTGPTWSWDMFVNREDTETALESLSTIATGWRMTEIRDTPGAVLALRYHIAGRTRRIYGRPRSFEGSPNNMILNGMMPFGADFKCVDAYHYDDLASGITLGLQTGSEGGFIFPTVFPVTTLPVGIEQSYAAVGGDADTYPVIRFNGPVEGPVISSPDWDISLNISLGADEYAIVDTRPWSLSALKNGSSSVAGALGRRQWLSDVRLSPGQTQLIFRGSSIGDGATCEVTWNNAWNSL
jgi:hypothetical protein